MAKTPKTDPTSLYHPVLTKLPPGARVLSGYIGPADASGVARIYASLANLDQYVEIEQSDIVHSEPDPASSDGKTRVWVAPDAEVTAYQRQRAAARNLPRRSPLRLSAETVRNLSAARVVDPTETVNCISGRMCTIGNSDCTCLCKDSDELACLWSIPCM